MRKAYHIDRELIRYHLKLPKEHSSFLYFVLEGHDNLSFYSTLPHEEGSQFRELELFSPIEFTEDLDRLWQHLEDSLKLQVLLKEIYKDI